MAVPSKTPQLTTGVVRGSICYHFRVFNMALSFNPLSSSQFVKNETILFKTEEMEQQLSYFFQFKLAERGMLLTP